MSVTFLPAMKLKRFRVDSQNKKHNENKTKKKKTLSEINRNMQPQD